MRDAALRDLLEATGGYGHGSVGPTWFIARDDLLDRVRKILRGSGSLYDWARTNPRAEAISGRTTLYLVPGPEDGRWVVRKLTHGGLLAPLTGDRFLRAGVPRPFNELRVSERLRDRGIPTPAVMAAVVHPLGPFYRGEVAREEVTDAADLAACMFDAERTDEERRAAMRSAGRLVGRIHRAGLIHPDLNLRNILVKWTSPEPTAYILDLEKCRFGTFRRLGRRRMLWRLQRSARRFEARSHRSITPEEWRSFWEMYASSERLL